MAMMLAMDPNANEMLSGISQDEREKVEVRHFGSTREKKLASLNDDPRRDARIGQGLACRKILNESSGNRGIR